ncbi:60S ribosomal protein L11 [Thalictrum thalictroides]|uniref:60S ribosomal protein L11 n=1 Tax=Thalictrum thalictroides TaxID=46969 RepID=A0A7J6VFQ8_THATH|nr:60S ribosomal protein L11 [Thalictrum thalictroides]
MDFFVVLERPGYRVGRRRRCKSRIGIQHRVTKDDAMKWFQVKYEGVILNKSQNITGLAPTLQQIGGIYFQSEEGW